MLSGIIPVHYAAGAGARACRDHGHAPADQEDWAAWVWREWRVWLFWELELECCGMVCTLPPGGIRGVRAVMSLQPEQPYRRYTLLHELGHHLLGEAGQCRMRYDDADPQGYRRFKVERRANDFANGYLLPIEDMLDCFFENHWTDEQIATYFDVPLKAVSTRLESAIAARELGARRYLEDQRALSDPGEVRLLRL